jgi:hypothetical protein
MYLYMKRSSHSKTRPFDFRAQFDHAKTRLIRDSDGHCIRTHKCELEKTENKKKYGACWCVQGTGLCSEV